ncbi:glycosyltransferase family 2 protein [Roseibium sp.]|uniref:glycosyltransferase family 2 protein n=1 Tax=Roseibium sp. TaxID=1936156 RepID=UPI003D0D1A91
MAQFTVLIPVLNGAELLGEALASVESQTLTDVRVIVSDNASTDATPEILEAWRDRVNLRVIRQEKTLPIPTHFNALLDAIETERYMLLCHDDYLADPDALRLADIALDENPDAPAVYCDLAYVNTQRRPLATRRFDRAALFSADEAGRETIRTTRNMFGIPLGVRTAALGAHRYDPRFHYLTDVDLSWSMAKGRNLAHVPQPLIANRYRAGNTTWSLLGQARSEYLAFAKKHGVPLGPLGKARLSARIWTLNQQKKLFGLYGRMVERR